MAGFSTLEVNKLTFKVQAAGVIDASAGNRWYESSLAFSPNIKFGNRILSDYNLIPIAALQATAIANAAAQPTIIQDLSASGTPGVPTQLDSVYGAGNTSTYIAYNTFGNPASGFKNDWIMPASIPQANGDPSSGYGIVLWSGDPSGAPGTFAQINPGTGQAPNPG